MRGASNPREAPAPLLKKQRGLASQTFILAFTRGPQAADADRGAFPDAEFRSEPR